MNMAQSTIVFDTHEAVQELTTAGVPERQAEAHVRLQARLIEQHFATKSDIDTLRQETRTEFAKLRAEIADLRAELKGDIANVRTEMADLRTSLTDKIDTSFRWLIGLQVGIAGILLAAIKLF